MNNAAPLSMSMIDIITAGLLAITEDQLMEGLIGAPSRDGDDKYLGGVDDDRTQRLYFYAALQIKEAQQLGLEIININRQLMGDMKPSSMVDFYRSFQEPHKQSLIDRLEEAEHEAKHAGELVVLALTWADAEVRRANPEIDGNFTVCDDWTVMPRKRTKSGLKDGVAPVICLSVGGLGNMPADELEKLLNVALQHSGLDVDDPDLKQAIVGVVEKHKLHLAAGTGSGHEHSRVAA